MRLSILHLIFGCIIFIIFVVFIFSKWQGKNEQIQKLNAEILLEQAKLTQIKDVGNKVLTHVRIIKGLDILAGKRLTAKQKEILTEKLFEISTDYKIDPILILAVIRHESRGNPNARGAFLSGAESGALGLMQIKYESALEVARSVGVRINSPEDLFIPEKNLMVGTAYLLRLIAKYKNLQYALIAYNVGFGTLDERLRTGQSLPQRYYNGVMDDYRMLTEGIFK